MKISKRLKFIGDLIKDKSVILDVGCDHALLDIYTVLNKKNIKAYASDINELPLEQAKKNIKENKLEKKIKTIQMNGIENVPKDANTIVISGLGGVTINNILNNNKENLKNIETIILSPNNDFIKVRKNLKNIGYYIEEEYLIEDKKVIYLILKLKKGNKKYSKKELFFGPILIKKQDKVFKKYFKDEIIRRNILLKLLPNKYFIKKYKIKNEINLINKNLGD